jgi:hypothetical protein
MKSNERNSPVQTKFLLGVTCFMRFDDLAFCFVSDILVDSIRLKEPLDGQLVVECIVLRVLGKSKTDWTHLALWRCDSHPELCPVRCLLMYLVLAFPDGDPEDSPLFPNSLYPDSVASTLNDDGTPSEALWKNQAWLTALYRENSREFVAAFTDALGRDGRWGMHT